MDLEERMKAYERVYHLFLPIRMPVIIRVDGRAFHTFTRRFERPFDWRFANGMDIVAERLFSEVQNARFCYIQSDEVSVLLVDYNRFDSQQWFGGELLKMASISASIASSAMTLHFSCEVSFDSRVFPIPEKDVCNYFLWRQRDATRNSIQMVARKYYSHKELDRKNNDEQQEMIFRAGDNWNDYPAYFKRGRGYDGGGILKELPIFSQDVGFLDKYLHIEEE